MSRYLSEEEVLDTENPFVQLLSGVVWLIRNGSIHINESQAAECDETQETGGEGGIACSEMWVKGGGVGNSLRSRTGQGGVVFQQVLF